MGIILGLTAAICWGTADFLARYATRLIGTYCTLFTMQFFGFVALSVYLIGTGELVRLIGSTSWQPWVWVFLVALLNVISSLALYRSFEVGVLAIVSPIAASSAALTVVLAFLNGEMVSQARGIGISAVLIGVVLAAIHVASGVDANKTEYTSHRKSRLTDGVGWAFIASFGNGIVFWLLGFRIIPMLGSIAPIWLIRLTTLCMLTLFATPLRQSIHLPRGRVWWFISSIGVLDTAAFIAAAVGFTNDQVSVVSVLASLFSVVTVILAWFFLRENLQWSQWLGISLIFLGVTLIKI